MKMSFNKATDGQRGVNLILSCSVTNNLHEEYGNGKIELKKNYKSKKLKMNYGTFSQNKTNITLLHMSIQYS